MPPRRWWCPGLLVWPMPSMLYEIVGEVHAQHTWHAESEPVEAQVEPQPGWPSLPVSPTLMRASGSGLPPGSTFPSVCAAIWTHDTSASLICCTVSGCSDCTVSGLAHDVYLSEFEAQALAQIPATRRCQLLRRENESVIPRPPDAMSQSRQGKQVTERQNALM